MMSNFFLGKCTICFRSSLYKINWFSHNIRSLKQEAQSGELKLSNDMENVVSEICKYWSNLNLHLKKTKLNITEVEKLDELYQIL